MKKKFLPGKQLVLDFEHPGIHSDKYENCFCPNLVTYNFPRPLCLPRCMGYHRTCKVSFFYDL